MTTLQLYYDLARLRSPIGGVTINGKHFRGGQFIPGKDLAGASKSELKELKKKQKNTKKAKKVAEKSGINVHHAANRVRKGQRDATSKLKRSLIGGTLGGLATTPAAVVNFLNAQDTGEQIRSIAAPFQGASAGAALANARREIKEGLDQSKRNKRKASREGPDSDAALQVRGGRSRIFGGIVGGVSGALFLRNLLRRGGAKFIGRSAFKFGRGFLRGAKRGRAVRALRRKGPKIPAAAVNPNAPLLKAPLMNDPTQGFIDVPKRKLPIRDKLLKRKIRKRVGLGGRREPPSGRLQFKATGSVTRPIAVDIDAGRRVFTSAEKRRRRLSTLESQRRLFERAKRFRNLSPYTTIADHYDLHKSVNNPEHHKTGADKDSKNKKKKKGNKALRRQKLKKFGRKIFKELIDNPLSNMDEKDFTSKNLKLLKLAAKTFGPGGPPRILEKHIEVIEDVILKNQGKPGFLSALEVIGSYYDLERLRAPRGGINVNGKFYKGGRFIPNTELGKASKGELKELKSRLSKDKHDKLKPKVPKRRGRPPLSPEVRLERQKQFALNQELRRLERGARPGPIPGKVARKKALIRAGSVGAAGLTVGAIKLADKVSKSRDKNVFRPKSADVAKKTAQLVGALRTINILSREFQKLATGRERIR